MDFNCKIKLGGVNNLTDARFGAAMQADWIGFCFDKNNAAYIAPLQAQAIIGWLSGPSVVAEFGPSATLFEIEDIIRLMGFEWIQVSNAEILAHFAEGDIKTIYEIDAKDIIKMASLNTVAPKADAILLKNCSMYDAELLQQQYPGKLIFDVENMGSQLPQLKSLHPFAINLSGGFETAPGIRDFEEMNAVFDLFREA